ncbi:hypothetical protein CFI00_15390 [Nocardioides sp. S5]|uniref:hypothetical protein n=1 Tax=Nocardioides sp. S5 TaxID=2017486 RepID=UPI001A906881|nr:hypothetical protein [Nocardioides sp. S5]QSR31867.1 hypothetical protein CFI00_15390 [Nocardioides sp. S5]
MNRNRRITATLLATAALAAPSALASTAEARPDKPAKTVKSQSKQLLKDIAGKDKRLARMATSNAVEGLADDTEAEVVANVTDARTALADLATTVEAADSTVDTRAARKELRSFRVENFRIVVNVVKKVERLEEAAAADPEAVVHLAAAEAAALEITATSTKADIRAVRAHVQAAQAELEGDTETETEGATA